MIRYFQKLRSNKSAHEAGFTLVEMMVALSLLAMITLLITQALRGGIAVTNRAERTSEQSELRQIRNYLSDVVSASIPLETIGETGDYSAFFHGDSQQFKFVTSHTVPGQYAGLYVTKFHLVPAASRSKLYDLWLDQHLFHRFAKTDRRVSPRVKLLEDIANVRFRYYGLEPDKLNPTWVSQWRNPKAAPTLVSIEIDFAQDDKRKWPPLIMNLKITQ